jgi:hypothetical protein
MRISLCENDLDPGIPDLGQGFLIVWPVRDERVHVAQPGHARERTYPEFC